MKFRIYIISLILLTSICAPACGYETNSAHPIRFHFNNDECRDIRLTQHFMNIDLWRSMTSPDIPTGDIEDAVYRSSLAQLKELFTGHDNGNTFIEWINTRHAYDLRDFLLLAKELEELRANRTSPWYYPSSKSGFDARTAEQQQFDSIIAVCRTRHKGRLADRYALQAVRALMSTGRYQQCIDIYNDRLASLPDSNLFKSMTLGCLAGCDARLGDTARADSIFAAIGDYESLSCGVDNSLTVMARLNPESRVFKEHLNDLIGYRGREFNLQFTALADTALASPRVINRGDWLYLKAYIEELFNRDHVKASGLITQALHATFSSQSMRDDARVMDICVRAAAGDLSDLLNNATFLVSQSADNALLFYVIPALLKQNRVTEALLLANCCSDNIPYLTYACVGFQTMQSFTARDIIAYKKFLADGSHPLVRESGHLVRHDSDFIDELIGTLYMREGDYASAVRYLSGVSTRYQRTMNIYPYLDRDPWNYCYCGTDKWDHPRRHGYEDFNEPRPQVDRHKTATLSTPLNAKLNFAREMIRLQEFIKNSTDADQRELARLKYTIARYNSFNTCWALTQYWCGNSDQTWLKPFISDPYNYYIELSYIADTPPQLAGMDQWFEREVTVIYNNLKSDEALAQANLTLRNYRTIARHYPDTRAGRHLAARCDRWSDWIQ